jgi:hypothetical protein
VNHRSLLSGARYRGVVRATKRNYHVFEGPKVFILLSPGTDGRGGNYHVIERQALNYLLGKVGGSRSVTTGDVRDACSRSKFFKGRFAVLNALYALTGIEKARIIGMRGQSLVFSVSKGIV